MDVQLILPAAVPSKRSKVQPVNVTVTMTESFGVDEPDHCDYLKTRRLFRDKRLVLGDRFLQVILGIFTIVIYGESSGD